MAFHNYLVFHLTGRTFAEELEPVDRLDVRPALLAPYRDLTSLRYDYPLVLARGRDLDRCLAPLSELIDAAVQRVTGGAVDPRTASHALRLEREIRSMVAAGDRGPLSVLCDAAIDHLIPSADPAMVESLTHLRAALEADGELIDCDLAAPVQAITHAWTVSYEMKARAFQERVGDLILKLSDILQADFVRSEAGHAPEILRASVGSSYEDAFDFDALSAALGSQSTLTPQRRTRIEVLIRTLTDQWVYPRGGDSPAAERSIEAAFVFDSCAAALAAYRDYGPDLTALSNALTAAELEVRGEYLDAHDTLLSDAPAGVPWLDDSHAAQFPDYLVRLNVSTLTPDEQASLMEMLALHLPIKVLLQTDDLLDDSSVLDGPLVLNARGRQFLHMAMGLGDVFVVQTPASHLVRFAAALGSGLRYRGPALFNVFSGGVGASDISPYIMAAAAMEARAFPAVTFDPAAGPGWSSRLSLAGNPQLQADWPVQTLSYEDESHREIREETAFTLADFIACDPRHGRHFARAPRSAWTSHLASVSDALDVAYGSRDRVPSLTVVDGGNVVQKVLVDDEVLRETRRYREMWRSLRALTEGAASPIAVRQEPEEATDAAAPPPVARPAALEDSLSSAGSSTPAIGAPPPIARPAALEDSLSSAGSSTDPYIETPRCSTCNECTRINNRMFAYNADKQAYIADARAGTYAQLVEAAESCQVSIIHPGAPRNPNEPGLEELLQRAAPFR